MRPHTIVVAQSERGWDVTVRLPNGDSFPMTSYPNAGKAAARVLQLMELTKPVTPQDWPESVCIGFVEGLPPRLPKNPDCWMCGGDPFNRCVVCDQERRNA